MMKGIGKIKDKMRRFNKMSNAKAQKSNLALGLRLKIRGNIICLTPQTSNLKHLWSPTGKARGTFIGYPPKRLETAFLWEHIFDSIASLCNKRVYRPKRFLNSWVTKGSTVKRSPTIPYVAILKMGASASLLIATMISDVFIPA